MNKPAYLDCNCSVGRVVHPYIEDVVDAAGLRKELDAAGIEEALVFHTFARDADPPEGNRLLMEAIAADSRMYPVWVVLPHHTGEMPRPDKLLVDMEAAGVKSVRMYPGKDHHSFSLAEWSVGELLAALEEARIPLMLDAEIVCWEAIASILDAHPRLPVIAINVGYRHDRFCYPLFELYPNLYVELSRFFGAGVLEDIVARFGTRPPVLFGTNLPHFAGTTSVSMLAYADIPEESKRAIAGGTLRKLLGEVYS